MVLGVDAVAAGVPAREELVEGGRDHPGPVVAERCISVVSLVVTNLEWDIAVWATGFSAGESRSYQ